MAAIKSGSIGSANYKKVSKIQEKQKINTDRSGGGVWASWQS